MLRSSQRIHEVAWSLAYRRHNSELPGESSPIEETMSVLSGVRNGYRTCSAAANRFTRWRGAWLTGDIIRSSQWSHHQLKKLFLFYPAFGTDTVHVPLQPTDSRGGVELGLPMT
ncbi:4-hydroxy-tetrahydrodipicolinate synthase [Trichinella spiralis]|uniref:4-hydroxy-tetrahydrodipicolinate synthase n=1 Tax=Trichinella spiralis TaxID=6334 RepID=A0ABR3KII5_TRISP